MHDKKILSREAILAADDYHREYVDMPEWGGGVYVQTISAKAGLEIANRGETNVDSFVESLLVRSVVDEAGQPIFAEGDISALMGKSRVPINRLTQAALRMNRLDGGTEEAEKN